MRCCSFGCAVRNALLDLLAISCNGGHDHDLRGISNLFQHVFIAFMKESEKSDADKVDAADIGGEGLLELLDGGLPHGFLKGRDVI